MPINPPVPTARRRRRAFARGPRRLWVLAAALLALLAGAATAEASGVSLQTDAGQKNVNWTSIRAGNVQGTSYALPDGTSVPSAHGMTVRALLQAAGLDPATVTSVDIGGYSVPPTDLDTAVVLAASGVSTVYVDGAVSTSGGQLTGAVSGGTAAAAATPTAASTPLTASVTIAPNPVSGAHQPVFFSASVTGPPGAIVHYSWSFGDGSYSTQVAPTYSYSADGDYPATLTVRAGGEAFITPVPITVHVGHPRRTVAGTGLGTSNATGSGSGGSGTGRGGNGGGANTGGTKGATQPKPAPKPAVRPPAPVAAPGAAAKAASAQAAAAGQPVRGILLADIGSPLDLHLSPPPPSGSPGAAHKSAGGSRGIAALLGGIALALAIVGLGGLAERRRVTLRLA
jgi:PKD repeat protein